MLDISRSGVDITLSVFWKFWIELFSLPPPLNLGTEGEKILPGTRPQTELDTFSKEKNLLLLHGLRKKSLQALNMRQQAGVMSGAYLIYVAEAQTMSTEKNSAI